MSKSEDTIEIDTSVIEDLADGDPAVIADLVAAFERHTADGIAKVRNALDAGQFLEAAQTAHTCVGYTATIGIIALVAPLRELETVLKAERKEEASMLVTRWELRFERVRQRLRSLISGPR